MSGNAPSIGSPRHGVEVQSATQSREIWRVALDRPGVNTIPDEAHDTDVATLDAIAVEEPLEIRVEGEPIAITMRTPGEDESLAAGFCLAEGIVTVADDIESVRPCPSSEAGNAVNVQLVPGARQRGLAALVLAKREFVSSSACGVCGARSIERIERATPRSNWKVQVPARLLAALPQRMLVAQRSFARTGGLHAAALFDIEGRLLVLHEDIGRHNAVDKVVGRELLLGRLPLKDRILVVSGRAGFELVQKAAMAQIPMLCAVGAPSTLAVDLARRIGLTLVGFLRAEGFNVYAGRERVGA